MASPTRPPPPPPAPPQVEPMASSSPPSQHPAVDPSPDGHGSILADNPAPAPALTASTSPPNPPSDSFPSSPSDPQMLPSPSPPLPIVDASPPSLREGQASPPTLRSPTHNTPAPLPPPPSAPPASSETRSEHEEAESASESGSMSLALALTQEEDSTPPTPLKASSPEASPPGSGQTESALTIAKLLSGEDLAAAEANPAADKAAPPSDTGSLPTVAVTAGGGGGVGSKRWLIGGGVPEKVRRRELRRAELGFRVSAAVFCMVSLSVMAADTTSGWSGDSFRRYSEYRYVLAASVMAFTYSGFQLADKVHYIVTRRHIIRSPWRSCFDLAMDQTLAYLLLSASSAALSRNDVWVSQFGGDHFTELINASASMAFLAFIALGLSSIISAYSVFSMVS